MNKKIKVASTVAAVIMSLSAIAKSSTSMVCWSMSCVVFSGPNGECGPVFEAPDAICDVQGVACP